MLSLALRIEIQEKGWIGFKKIVLLEHIAESGPIAEAARAIGMTYKNAWDALAEMSDGLGQVLVTRQTGGKKGGGAQLTPQGHIVVESFRAMEDAAIKAAAKDLRILERKLQV